MTDNVSTILDVKLDAGKVAEDLQDLVTRIAALKAQQKDLNDQIKAGNDVNGKYAEQLIHVKDQLSWTEKQAKGLSATTKLLNADTLTYSDSLNGQRQKLADMQKAYDQMDAAMRDSEGGKAFLSALQAQSEVVKRLEAETGRAQRNVGNYPQAWAQGVPALNKVQKVLGSMGVTMQDLQQKGVKAFAGLGDSVKMFGKAFITPPIIVITAVLSAIMLVINKVSEAFKKNDNAMTALQKAFAVFKPIGEAVGKVFNWVAEGLGKVATAVAGAVSWIAGKLSPAYKEAADRAQELVQAQDDLEEAERDYTVNSAKRNSEISELKAKAAEKDKYTAAERKQMMQDAIDLERQNLEEQKKITAERLRLLEAEAKQNNDTSDATKDKIAQARAAMYQAEEQYYSGIRKLNSQMTTFEREEQAERTRIAEEARKKREEAAKAEEQAAAERAKNAQDIARMAEDFALSLIEDETAKAIAQRQIAGDREIADLKKRLETEKNLTEESRQQLNDLIIAKQVALEEEINRMAEEAAAAKDEAEIQAEQERTQRILEYRLQLAQEGSETELELQQELLQLKLEQELSNAELSEEEKYLIRETYAQKAKELDDEYNENLKLSAENARAAYANSFKSISKSASTAFGALSEMLSQYGEENAEAQQAAKAFGVMQIVADQAISIADTAKAITAAVAGATEAASAGGPAAPFLLAAYIASMVGAVVAAIAGVASSITQAKQLISGADAGKFATGGVVGGNSYTGDRLIAHVNSGEGILTGAQANNILQEVANNPARGGFDMDTFAAVTAAAVASQPAPVVVYSELQEFGQKVSTYNEIASI